MAHRVLVVDSDAESLAWLKAHLEPLGCACRGAPSGQGAIDAVETKTAAFLTLDAHPSEKRGIDLSPAFRRKNKLGLAPFTHRMQRGEGGRGLGGRGAGAKGVGEKPPGPSLLTACFRQLLRLKATRD